MNLGAGNLHLWILKAAIPILRRCRRSVARTAKMTGMEPPSAGRTLARASSCASGARDGPVSGAKNGS